MIIAGLTGEVLFAGLMKYGPIVFEWAKSLFAVWKTEMTPEQLNALADKMPKTYEEYIAAAGGRPAITAEQLATLKAKFTPDQVAALLAMFPAAGSGTVITTTTVETVNPPQ